ncbi:hypothetical protein [uncultured Psychroserpens sp.]|uniref:hypothetical protein n=1 Tax=uncultured Psychroserpens sp. TaxID=255436 RepID=UPI00260CB736|nr:hypothetical protein [uncultured Psychroserpens sp.]
MKTANQLSKLLLCLILLFNANAIAQDEDSNSNMLLPSEALTLMMNEVNMHPEKKRIDATKPYLPRVITTELSREEQFYLGDVYFWNFMPQESLDAFSKVKDGNDEISRAAWQRIMQINFRAFEKHGEVEKQISEFRKHFKPNPKDQYYMFEPVNNVCGKHAGENNHKKVVELVEEELKTIDYNGAYQSFLLPAYQFNSYKVLGKGDTALSLLEKAKNGLQNALDNRRNAMPENDPDYLIHTSRVRGMETIVTNKLSYKQMNDEYEKLIESITKAYNYFKGQ